MQNKPRVGWQKHSCKVESRETQLPAAVLHWRTNLMKLIQDLQPADKAQADILSAQLQTINLHFAHDLDSMFNLTLAQYGVDPAHPRISYVFDSLRDIMRSRLETRGDLYRQSLKAIPDEEFIAIRKRLARKIHQA
jgi:hypothetical protein